MGKRAAKPTNNNNSNPNPAKRPSSASIILSGPEISNESNNHHNNNNYSSDEVVSSSELSFSSSTIPSAQHQNHLGLKKVASTNQPVLGENNSTVVVNRVVSSNPTLNLLLSTPIKTTATGKGTTTPGGNGSSNRSKKASTKQTNAKTKVTSAIGGTKTSCGSVKSSSIIGGDTTATSASNSDHSTQSKAISFVDEIGKMMHSFGDTKIPMPESARLIESIVKHQLMMILEEAELIATQRNSTTIGHEELLFLLKNDRDKLARLIRHLSFKDLKPKLTSNLDSDQIQKSVPSLTGPLLYSGGLTGIQHQHSQQHPNTNSTDDDDSTNVDQLSSATTTFLKPNHLNHHHHNHHHCPTTKRVKLCHQFLSEIETPFGHCSSRSLLKVFSDDFVDRITLNRNRRLSAFTESLAIKDYYYYQACRSVSFIPNSSLSSSSLSLADLSGQTTTATNTTTSTSTKGNKFYEWLIVPYHQERNPGPGGGGAGGGRSATNNLIIKPNSLAVEILQFLAHETVAILVELALVIRDEQNQTERTEESQVDQWSAQLSSKFMEAQKKVAAAAQASGKSGPFDTSQTSVEDILNKASVSMMSLQKSSQRSSDLGPGPSVNGKPNRINSSSSSSWNSFSNRFNAHNSITPANIMEAMRRFERAVPRNFLARFSRSHSQMPNTATCSRRQRILCL